MPATAPLPFPEMTRPQAIIARAIVESNPAWPDLSRESPRFAEAVAALPDTSPADAMSEMEREMLRDICLRATGRGPLQ